jgi:lambda family phage tail tape measure protein
LQATIHTQQYTAALQKLQDQAAYIKGDRSYTSEEARQAALLNNQTAQGQLNVNRQIQVGVDSQNTNPAATSGLVGAKNALDDFVTSSQNAAAQMHELATNTLQGLNAQIVDAISGKKTNFGAFGAGVARSVAGTALNKAEGSALGMFGFGGKPGTQNNPMYVRIVGALSGIASGAASNVSSVAGSTGGFFGKLLKSVLPGFAAGGSISGPSIVGEQGPELFIPGQSGTIVPNHKLVNSGGGGIHFHPGAIDARGATDPAQVDAAVRRGIAKAAPQLTAASVQAMNEHNKRRGK